MTKYSLAARKIGSHGELVRSLRIRADVTHELPRIRSGVCADYFTSTHPAATGQHGLIPGAFEPVRQHPDSNFFACLRVTVVPFPGRPGVLRRIE